MSIQVSFSDLTWASEQGLISGDQAASLWGVWSKKYEDQPRFRLVHVLYYFGAVIVISAMACFLVLTWDSLGGVAIFFISTSYASCFYFVGWRLWQKPLYRIAGGLCITVAVSITPLVIYALLRMTKFWPLEEAEDYMRIRCGFLLMEVATVLVGLCALSQVKFPFLTCPITAALFGISMDLGPLIFRRQDLYWFEELQRQLVSIIFGSIILIASYLVDRRTKADFAFWGYIWGLLAFWTGLSELLYMRGEGTMFIYCLVNVLLVLLSVFLSRRVFAVFGAVGLFLYFSYLALSVFRDSLLFPFVLTLLGISIMLLGVAYEKYLNVMERSVLTLCPMWLRRLRPTDRDGTTPLIPSGSGPSEEGTVPSSSIPDGVAVV